MRVLHVAQPTTAGVARVVVQLAAAQARSGTAVSVACPDDGTLPAEAVSAGASHVPWPATRSPGPSVPGEVRRLAAVVAAVGADVVHLHSSKAGLAGRLVVRGRTPTVFSPHAWSFLAQDSSASRPARAWERWAARWTDAFAVVSADEERDGRRAGVVGRYALVGNGVDLVHHAPAAPDRPAGVPRPAGPLAVCVGRLCAQKGQDVLLTAWPQVLAAVPDASLVLVGDGPDRARLEAARPPGVQLVGGVPDPRAWLGAADVVVLPSRWEGLSLVLLEAMAAGRSVVTTDVAGAREALGDAGAVVGVGDPAALARALVRRLRDPALTALEGVRARARVEARHDLGDVVARVDALYAEVLARR